MSPVDLKPVLAQISPLHGYQLDDFTVTRLPGLTNLNFRLHNPQQDWVLRLPRDDTNAYIDRVAEAFNQALACELGIAPRVAWRDASGKSLTPTLATSRALTSTDFTHPGILRSIVEPIRRLHQSGMQFQGRVDLAELLTRYYGLLDTAEQKKYGARMRRAQAILEQPEFREQAWVASHNDLVLENLLFDSRGLWLIDWEYSAMASPYWDLATLCNAANLDAAQSASLLAAYCVDGGRMEESVLSDYRNLLQLLSDCWITAFAPR